MLYIAFAMFEYAILLAINFGKQNKIAPCMSPGEEEMQQEKCHRIDRYALRGFVLAYALTISTYFSYTLYIKSLI